MEVQELYNLVFEESAADDSLSTIATNSKLVY